MDSVVVKFDNFYNFKETLNQNHFTRRKNSHKKMYKSTNKQKERYNSKEFEAEYVDQAFTNLKLLARLNKQQFANFEEQSFEASIIFDSFQKPK